MTPVFRELHPQEQAECLALWTQVFAPDTDYFERYFQDPLWQPAYTRVCELNGRLVAALQLVRRPVRLSDGHSLWMAGVANVATLPEYRGRGFASRLLQDLHAVMHSEEFAFGLLFTGIHDFYRRWGWERLPLPLWEATPRPFDLAGWRFRVAEPDDLSRIQHWYTQFYADHPLSVVRSDAYWHIWTRWDDPQWRHKFYLAEDPQGNPRGYLALETYHDHDENGNRRVSGIGVAELGCPPDDTDTLRHLVGFASQTAHMAGATLWLSLPQTDIERLVRPLLPEVRWVGNGGAMVRISCWEAIYDALESLNASAPENLAKLGHAGALALLFGLPAPEGVEIAPELRARYPLRPACYSPVDSF